MYTCGCASSLTAGLWIPCQHFMIFTRYIHLITRFIETHTITANPPVVNRGLDHPIHQEIDWTYLNLEALKVLCFTSLLCSRTSCCCVHGSGYWSCWAFFMDTEPWGWLSWKMDIRGFREDSNVVSGLCHKRKDINKSTKESIKKIHATVLNSIDYLWTLKFFDWRCFSLQASQTTRSVVSANSVDDWLKTSYGRFGLKFVTHYGHGQ